MAVFRLERYFSKKNKEGRKEKREKSLKNHKRKSDGRIPLDLIDSNEGLGTALVTAPFTGLGSLTGGYFGKHAAEDADDEGLDDEQIISRAARRGALVGGLTGAVVGPAGTYIPARAMANIAKALGNKNAGVAGALLSSSAIAGGLGAIGGYNAAKENAKDRIFKRMLREEYKRR